MLRIKKTDFEFKDERGTLVQLIHDGYRQINVITSRQGSFRGGHYHKENDEAFYVISGSLKVKVEGGEHIFSAGDFFGVEANDLHSFYFLEDTTLVSMYSDGVERDDGTKDIYVKE